MSDISNLIERLQKLDNVKDERMIKKIQSFMNDMDNYEGLDHDLVELLKYMAEHDEATLYDKDEYANICTQIESTSTVIYFKSAGLFRIYTGAEFEEKFQNHIRTNYRGQEEIYEVVDDTKPQKIMIIVDTRNTVELEKVKQYTVDYFKHLNKDVNTEDLAVFNNIKNETYEIVVQTFPAESTIEKKTFVDGLLTFIEEQENNAIITRKVGKREVSEIKGTHLNLIPELKELLNGGNILNGYVTKTGNIINIGTLNLINTQVNGDHATVNNMVEPVIDLVEEFRLHLETKQYDWCNDNDRVSYEKLFKEYNTLHKCSKKRFTQLFRNELFTNHRREQENNKREAFVKILL